MVPAGDSNVRMLDPVGSHFGFALVAFEESADGFTDFGDDRVNDHDANEEGDEGQFVGCGEGEHHGVVFSYHLARGRGGLSYIVGDCFGQNARTSRTHALTLWPLESKDYGVSSLDDTPHTVHRDVILMADASPEGLAIAAALRTQGFAVASSSIDHLEVRVLDESPRVLIVDIDEPGARDAIERIRELAEGTRAELVCLGNPARAAEVGATTASGRAFARPVDIHAIIAQIGALADPAPLDEEFIDDGLHDGNPRRSGESMPPLADDGTGAFSMVFQSVFPAGPDVSEMGSSIFPPEENEGQSPNALLAAHPMQLSPELTELLANAEQKVMLADAFVSLPPAPQLDDDADVLLGDEYLSLLDAPIDTDDDAPGTGPEMAQTGNVELPTGSIALHTLATTQASPSAAVAIPETLPPMTSANVSSVGGSPPVDTTPPIHRAMFGHVSVREPIKVREVVSDKLPISYADEPSIPRPPPVAADTRPTTSANAITVVEPLRPNRAEEEVQRSARRTEPPAVIASVKRPVAPIVIETGLDAQPPTVFPGRMASSVPKIEVAPLTSPSSPTTQQSIAARAAPSTLNPPTINPPTAIPPSPQVPSSQPPTIEALQVNPLATHPLPSQPTPRNSPTLIPPTAKPQSPPRYDVTPTSKPLSPPLAVISPPISSQPSPSSATPSSPRPTKPTPLLPPPNVRRGASDPAPSVRLAPPVPPPPSPVVIGGATGSDLEISLQNDKPTVLSSGDAPRALARAIASRVTGSLALHTQGVVRRVVLQEGDVVTAGSGAAEESLLSFLAARGDLERDIATRLATKLPPGGRHAGAALIAHGYLSQDALWSVLRAHSEWLIGGFLLVDSGTLELESEAPGRLRAEPSVFGGSMGAEVFVESVRRVIAPDVALSRLGGTAARMDGGSRFALLAECALRPDEQAVVTNAQGATIGELMERSGSDVSTLLYALVCLEVLSVLVPSKRSEKSRAAAPDPLDEEAIRMRVRARLALVEEGDYFAVLGVPRGATSYEIRRAFIDLRRSFEPSRLLTAATADLTGDVRTVLEVLDEAYEILKDAHRRERYRRAIEAGPA